MPKKIYVIAGEASGDLHGSILIENLKTCSGEPLEIYGVGGDRIRRTGALDFFDLAHFHVTGFSEALKRLPQYKKAAVTILAGIQKTRPDAVVLIDNPGFNLHLARKIDALGIPVIYYIAPQVWAWAPKRIFKIKKYVRKVLVVFEFEKALYEERGIPVEWVGHPLKDLIGVSPEAPAAAEETRRKKGPVISLLPGSRKGELKLLFLLMLEAAKRIADRFPGASFRLIKSPTLPRSIYERLLGSAKIPVTLVEKDPYEAVRQSDLAIVCSGTATLECALLGTPMIITNRGSLLTYALAKCLCRVPYLGLPNLILGEMRMPELLQNDATPEKLADTAAGILSDEKKVSRMREALKEVSRKLGEPGASKRAALEVLKVLGESAKEPAGILSARNS
jgi:lipid-A-disaccharide synthase